VADLLRRQVTSPVRFTEMVQQMVKQGVTAVLEVGPGRVLTGLVARIERNLARANLGSGEELSSAEDFVYQNVG
jgi:[acyl-carrier-protein] S-malonyltransferase